MKSLNTLIKLSKNKLDQIVVELNGFEEEKAILLTNLNLILEETNKEAEAYYSSEYSFMLEKYLNKMHKKQNAIKLQINRLEGYIEKRRDMLREEYSELKKYEIILQMKQKEEYLKAQKDETKLLDSFSRGTKY